MCGVEEVDVSVLMQEENRQSWSSLEVVWVVPSHDSASSVLWELFSYCSALLFAREAYSCGRIMLSMQRCHPVTELHLGCGKYTP